MRVVSEVEGWFRVFSGEFMSLESISNLLSEVSDNSPLKGGAFSAMKAQSLMWLRWLGEVESS